MPFVYLVFEMYRDFLYNPPVETFSLIAAFHKLCETGLYVKYASAARRLARQEPHFYWVTRVDIGDIGGKNETNADWHKKFDQRTQIFNAYGQLVVQRSDFDGGEKNELSSRTSFWVVLSQETSNDKVNPNPDRVRGVYTTEKQAHQRIDDLNSQEKTVHIGIVPVHKDTVFNKYVSLWKTKV